MNANKEDSMRRVAQFSKVSKEQFVKDWCNTFDDTTDGAVRVYEDIKLPKRSTLYSAGYDFLSPIYISLDPGETIKIPTGIRVEMLPTFFLAIVPRSGLGFKFRTQLDNTIGIIDCDYYNADNEGHIFCKMTNDTHENKTVVVERGQAFCQGIFLPYYITVDDEVSDVRIGGFGSTTK